MYRRDAKGHLIQGWRTWIIDAAQHQRWVSLRDSLADGVAHLVARASKCRDAELVGRVRITSWPLNGYEVAMVTSDPERDGGPAYEVTVALGPLSHCEAS